ncbi:MAG TPA: exodeoxyribonuclease III [Deltaproteobacteria bacterium]|nr:exodeoxyribonuclease III [Deltaproteobacteria bacterium]HPR51943.1 exodeoxyribonuclease III [Deltaproteobacteria bacterium]
MKIVSWNVNGLRAVIKNGFIDSVSDIDPDILCIQETRAHKDQISIDLLEYTKYWYSAQKKGYSGTAIFSKIEPTNVSYGLGIPEHDNEGRVITLEFNDFYLVNVYTPNSQHELVRLEYRQIWDSEFLAFVKRLEETKPVVFCGDLNVAHKEIDLKNPKSNERNPGFTLEERTDFDRYIESGFIDTFREFNQEPGNYTWWSYRFNARAKNIGWRIDYFCISASLRPQLKDAFILKDVMGSDHCPVGIILNES